MKLDYPCHNVVSYDFAGTFRIPLFRHSEAMIAKMGPCVLDERAVIRYVLAELLASNVRGAMRKDIGPSPESMAS